VRAEVDRGAFTATLSAQVALGPNHQTVSVAGQSTARTPDGTTQSFPSGLFAVNGTNAGRSTTNWFAVSPEVNLRFGYRFTDAFFAFVGYDFMYLNNVVRPGTEVNPNINLAFVPSSPTFITPANRTQLPLPLVQPALPSLRDDFWAQGLQFGIEFRF
jgi:hypothetical protein